MLRHKSFLIALATVLGVGSAQAQIKVGITMSASGPGAALGQPQSKTVAALAKEIGGQKVQYFALDDESDPTKGAQNARKLITEEKVDVLLGSSLTPVSLPLIDIAAEAKTPLLSLAAAAVLVSPMDDKKKWVFKVVPNDDIMANAILKYIAKSGVKTLGYIGVSDAYGEGYYKVLSEAAPKLDQAGRGVHRLGGHARGAAAEGVARTRVQGADLPDPRRRHRRVHQAWWQGSRWGDFHRRSVHRRQ